MWTIRSTWAVEFKWRAQNKCAQIISVKVSNSPDVLAAEIINAFKNNKPVSFHNRTQKNTVQDTFSPCYKKKEIEGKFLDKLENRGQTS